MTPTLSSGNFVWPREARVSLCEPTRQKLLERWGPTDVRAVAEKMGVGS